MIYEGYYPHDSALDFFLVIEALIGKTQPIRLTLDAILSPIRCLPVPLSGA